MEKDNERFRGKTLTLERTRRTIFNPNVSLSNIQAYYYVTPPPSLVGPIPSLYAKKAIEF